MQEYVPFYNMVFMHDPMYIILTIISSILDKNEEGDIPIMPRGDHKFPFDFQLPESALPCSFESKIGTIRYYLRVIIDIPYASPPQGLKYFTIIGPHIDCMEDRYLVTRILIFQEFLKAVVIRSLIV